jgi:hypothetical protein
MVLFKLVSFLVSIDIYVTSMASSDMNESNYFDLFFYGYAVCDFTLSIVGIALMALRFLADFLVAGARLRTKNTGNSDQDDEEDEYEEGYWKSSLPFLSCMTITFLIIFLIISFQIVQKHFGLAVLLGVLFTLIGLLVASCVFLRCGCNYAAKIEETRRPEENLAKRRGVSWAKRLNFLSDVCNLLVVLGLCIFLSVYIADTQVATTTMSQSQNLTSIMG